MDTNKKRKKVTRDDDEQAPQPVKRTSTSKEKMASPTRNENPMENADGDEQEHEFNLNDLVEIENLQVPPPPVPVMNLDGSGARLLITHIVNENFKSYAGRHVLGPFHKNFTAIVGPNGSGKSNVIDSLLFVFGYRAQKIRSKKISVLIHNSDSHTNIDSCTVEIHFVKALDKDDNEYDVVEGSLFHVSRTAYRDNSSEYRLNGKRVHFKELSLILRENGIDLVHNRFLILQGEVEQIALMKPKALQDGDEGMLEYLEDIIGSSRLVPYIDQLNKKCEEVNEIRNEKVNRVKAVESEKADLEPTKNEAVEFMLLENEITRKKNLLCNVHRFEAEENCETLTKERDGIKEEFDEHEKRLKEFSETIRAKKDEYENFKKQFDVCSAEAEKHKAKFSDMEKEDTKLREDLKHCRGRTKTLTHGVELEKKKLKDLREQPAKTERQLDELKSSIDKLETKQPKLETKLQEATAKLRDETKDLQASKEKSEQELVKYQKTINEARSKLDIAKSELEICLSAQTNETKKLASLETSHKTVVETLGMRENALKAAENAFAQTEKLFPEKQKELRDVTANEARCSAELNAKRAKADEARGKMQMSRGRGGVLDALLDQKRKGTIPGIIGRLGDLGAIDEKYDVAISTALGRLDNIVVDTIDTAQICVDFLKRNNVGTATFIALDKQAKFVESMRKRIETPENALRLFDLIRVDDETVLPAFYFGIRDTLVCDTLDQATRIGLQGRTRWRVVTLNGDIVEISGTLSGGGRPMRGRIGRSVAASPSNEVTPETLKQMDDELQEQTRRVNDLRRRRVDLEEALDKLGRESKRLKSDMDKLQIEIATLAEQEKSLKRQIAAQTSVVEKTVPDEKDQKRLQKNVEQFEKELEKVNSAGEKLKAEVDKYHGEIMKISERLVGAAQKELDACKRELDDFRKNMTKATVAAKTAARNLTKTEDKVKSLQEELAENEANEKSLCDKIKELENVGVKVIADHDEAEKRMMDFAENVKKAKKAFEDDEEAEQKLQSAAMDKKERLDHAQKTLKEFTQKKHYWEKEIKKLKLNDLSDLKPLVAEKAVVRSDPDDSGDEDEAEETPPTSREHEDRRFEFEELAAPSVEELKKVDKQALIMKLSVDEDLLRNMKPNLSAIPEYRKKVEKYKECVRQLEEVTSMRDKIRAKYEELRKQRLNEFLTGFSTVASKLKEMYQMITLGGDADLELVDTMDPFSEGIAFSVRPPKKSWKQISNLSGGEKTLSSLALVFALHHYKPTPLYVMDEIDAALDFRNVSIVANYIKERTKNAQFIIISLRNNMFELCDRLVGIYKTYNCTKSVTVDPNKISIPPMTRVLAPPVVERQRQPLAAVEQTINTG